MKAFLLILTLLAPAPLDDGQEAFDKGLERVQKLMAKSQWKRARTTLEKLLREHEGKAYAQARRGDVEEAMKRCHFWAANGKALDPKKLVSGKLKGHDVRSGRVRLEYDTKNVVGDFHVQGKAWIHKAPFAGPHTIEFSGKRWVKDKIIPGLLVCSTDEGAYRIEIGVAANKHARLRGNATRIVRVSGGESEVVAEKDSVAKAYRPYKIKVKVTNNTIVLVIGGRTHLTVPKEENRYGRFAILGDLPDKLKVEGKAEPSWLQGKVDKAVQERLAKFDKKFKPRQVLPAWIFKRPRFAKAEVSWGKYPGDPDADDVAILDEAMKLHGQKETKRAMALLRRLDEQAPAAEAYLRAVFNDKLGETRVALEQADRSIALDAGFPPARLLRGTLLGELRRREEGITALTEIVEKHPHMKAAYAPLVEMLILEGRPDEAKEYHDRALGRGVVSIKLTLYGKVLVKAMNGPAFRRPKQYESKHYHIVSDIDERTCREAASVLEAAYKRYEENLGRIADATTRRFKVYIFSGKASYDRYSKNLLGRVPAHTAGLYSPTLKQLLIWNLPERADMIRTIRHEGFHQFLDRVMDDPPRWFNEGLAEYYEAAAGDFGVWKSGRVRPEHLRTLDQKKPLPLQDFLVMPVRAFYANMRRNYPQAWATVHFLRHTTPENKARFERLYAAFQGEKSNDEIIGEVFSGVDWKALDQAFRAHLKALAAQ